MFRLSSRLLLVCLLAAALLPSALAQDGFTCNTTVVSSPAWNSTSNSVQHIAANLLLLFPLAINESLYGLPAYALTIQLAVGGNCGHKCPVITGRMGLYSSAGLLLNQTTPFAWDSEYQTTVEATIATSPLLPAEPLVYVGLSSNVAYYLYTTHETGGYKLPHSGSGEASLPPKFIVKNASKLTFTGAFQLAVCDS